MRGTDEEYGGGTSQSAPVEQSSSEQFAPPAPEQGQPSALAAGDATQEISATEFPEPGHTDRAPHFRAWRASQTRNAVGLSFWRRCTDWMGRLFHRSSADDAPPVDHAPSESFSARFVDHRSSSDDFDPPWGDPLEDRGATTDALSDLATIGSDDALSADPADPVWDAPRVASDPQTSPDPLAAEEIDDVDLMWSPDRKAGEGSPRSENSDNSESDQASTQVPSAADFEFSDALPDIDERGRITEAVDLSITDEDRKTDEFDVMSDDDRKTDEFDAINDEAPSDAAGGESSADTDAGGRSIWSLAKGLFSRGPAADVAAITASEAQPQGSVPVVSGETARTKMPFVLAKFRTFYNEIIRDKHQKADVISGFATAIVSAPTSELADPEFAAQLLSKRLSEMLELQAAESNWTGGDAAKYYPEAQYAMVALADETFSTIDWPGRSAWHKHKLEPRLYGSRGADLELFRRIDRLLRDPNPPRGARDLARLYLLVISSGFRGKFREPNLTRPLAEYRRRLYEFSHREDPLELYARDRTIFPDAVERTLVSRAVGRFTPAQRWIATAVVLTLVYVVVSHLAWRQLSADLYDVLSRVELSTLGGSR
jgi:type VI secretion system protein ImpK